MKLKVGSVGHRVFPARFGLEAGSTARLLVAYGRAES